MAIFTEQKVSPSGKLNSEDLKKWGMNFLKFVAPTLVIFFSLLSQGVGIDKAWPVALLAFYQSLADILGKLNSSK
jgi:hypothetical protein